MSITVNVELGYEMDVKAPAPAVFALLADVPTSASFYPQVEQLVDLGGGAYRWEMEKIGMEHINLQTVYASKYVSNKTKGSITWTPVKGEGNAQVSGSWTITDKKTHTHIVLQVQGAVSVPLPALMTVVVTPVVEAEFEKLTEQYLDNLAQRFGGEV